MKTCRITAPRTVEIQEIDDAYRFIPAGACASDAPLVTVKLEITCLCGSDSPFFNYNFEQLKDNPSRPYEQRIDYTRPYPLQPGLSLHECVGTVVESQSKAFSIGQSVLALPYEQCGFFEYLTLPENRIFALPDSDKPKDEILMCQPLGTILFGLRKLPTIAGKSIAIIGQGPIGLLMTQLFKLKGAKTIIALDKIPERLAYATEAGADHALTNDPASLKEIEGLADIVIEVAGHQEAAIQTAVSIAPHDGTVFTFGVIDRDDAVLFPYRQAFEKNLTLLNSVGAQHAEHFKAAADLIAQGEINVKPLLTHRFAVDQVQEAYETFVDRKDGVIKALIDFSQ